MRLVREQSPLPRLLVAPFAALAAFGFLWLRLRPDIVTRLARCPLKESTGIPCPTCGGTHAAAALAAGDFPAALAANPLVALAGLGLAGWTAWAILATVIPPLRRALLLSPREKKAARIGAALFILFAWTWQFVR